MFHNGEEWYHISTLDIKLRIKKLQYWDSKRIKIRADIVNRHNNTYYTTGTYTIKQKELKYWKLII